MNDVTGTDEHTQKKNWIENERIENFSHHGLRHATRNYCSHSVPCFMVTRLTQSSILLNCKRKIEANRTAEEK